MCIYTYRYIYYIPTQRERTPTPSMSVPFLCTSPVFYVITTSRVILLINGGLQLVERNTGGVTLLWRVCLRGYVLMTPPRYSYALLIAIPLFYNTCVCLTIIFINNLNKILSYLLLTIREHTFDTYPILCYSANYALQVSLYPIRCSQGYKSY